MKFTGDLPFSIYSDFETTPGRKIYNFDEDSTLYPVSYAFVVAFHPSLIIDKIFVVRSFNHTFEQLNDVRYLSHEILPYFDPITARQLRDCVQAVHAKKERFSLSKMFSCKLKFIIDLLKRWLAEKYFRRYKELDFFTKQKFKRENPIDWNKINCAICGFRLQIVVLLNTSYSNESDVEDISDDCISEFVNEMNFDSFSNLFLEVENTEIKIMKWENRKNMKLNKLTTFVYCSIMDFPENKFEMNTVVTKCSICEHWFACKIHWHH